LVGERVLVGSPYLADPDLRRAYGAEIAPRTTIALAKILAEVYGTTGRGHKPETAPRRVLDLGAGTGAAGDAARAFFGAFVGAQIEVVSVDRVAGPGGPTPGVLTADLVAPGALAAVCGPLDRKFDLILAAHLLNELFVAVRAPERTLARAQKVRDWCETLLAPEGIMVIVEPALRETSRELLAVRDRLLEAGLRVIAPCLWTGPCPALARERDWCHDAAAGDSQGPGQRARRVDFSYLALRAAGEPRSGAPDAGAADPALFRIVSDALVDKGRLRFFGCGPSGRDALVRLNRHRTAANLAFDRLARGDLARIAQAAQAGDGRRIGAETIVENLTQVPAE
jgi:SAM-dependent methyltransferase